MFLHERASGVSDSSCDCLGCGSCRLLLFLFVVVVMCVSARACVCVCMCSMGGTEGMLCAIYSCVLGTVCVCLSIVVIVVVIGNTTHRDGKPKTKWRDRFMCCCFCCSNNCSLECEHIMMTTT